MLRALTARLCAGVGPQRAQGQETRLRGGSTGAAGALLTQHALLHGTQQDDSCRVSGGCELSRLPSSMAIVLCNNCTWAWLVPCSHAGLSVHSVRLAPCVATKPVCKAAEQFLPTVLNTILICSAVNILRSGWDGDLLRRTCREVACLMHCVTFGLINNPQGSGAAVVSKGTQRFSQDKIGMPSQGK